MKRKMGKNRVSESMLAQMLLTRLSGMLFDFIQSTESCSLKDAAMRVGAERKICKILAHRLKIGSIDTAMLSAEDVPELIHLYRTSMNVEFEEEDLESLAMVFINNFSDGEYYANTWRWVNIALDISEEQKITPLKVLASRECVAEIYRRMGLGLSGGSV